MGTGSWDGMGAGELQAGYGGGSLRRVGVALVLALCLGFVAVAPASASTSYVDGISDQSLPLWDGGFSGSYFGGFFHASWVGSPPSHVTLARYVVQWNVMSGSYPAYRSEFESWLNDIASLGLTPDLALTSYDGVYPASPAEYKTRLQQVLGQARTMGHSIRYLEAWNEPNNQGHESAINAAHFTNEAYAACSAEYACTIIAGNLEDSPSVGSYEDEYRTHLSPVPSIWGVHPYYSVEERSETPIQRVVEHMPNGGTGDQLWITEVATRKCKDFNGLVENGEIGQAERANWLVNTLIHNRHPEHVFYYEFLLKNHLQPNCVTEGADNALYVPSSDPNAPDAPRAAASYIWNGKSVPWGYTGGATGVQPQQATLTASIYPGGFLGASYHFEYGTTTAYGSYTPEGQAGSGTGRVGVAIAAALAPGTTYHYRIVAWNSEGSTVGEDRTLTTPGPVEAVTGTASGLQQTQAVLNGTVNPRGYDAKYYFQYGETVYYGSSTSEDDAGAGTSPESKTATIANLEFGATYHYRLVATSGGVTSYGQDQVFTTLEAESSSDWVVREPASNELKAFFIGSEGGGRVCYWGYNRGWADNCLVGETVAKGSTPTAVTEPATSELTTYFIGNSGRVCYWGYNRGWADNCLGVSGEVAPDTSLSAVHEAATNEGQVFFISHGRVCYWGYNRGWAENCLGTEGYISPGTGIAAVQEVATSELTVYFVSGGRVCYWGYNRGWAENCLGAEGYVTAGSGLAAVNEPVTSEGQVYFVSGGRVCYWGYNRGWAENCLGAEGYVTQNFSLAAVSEPETRELTVYFVSGGRVCYWGYNRGWAENCLGTEGYVTQGTRLAAWFEPPTSEGQVYFVSGGRVCYWGYNRGWAENCLGTEGYVNPEAPVYTAVPTVSPTSPHQAVAEAATTGSWTNGPTSYLYQWERCNTTGSECSNISGATSSIYVPVEADVGHTLLAKVTAMNSGGSNFAVSVPTNKVQPPG